MPSPPPLSDFRLGFSLLRAVFGTSTQLQESRMCAVAHLSYHYNTCLRIVVSERQRVMQQHDPQNGGGDPSESSAASIRLTPPPSPAASQGNSAKPKKIWSKLALQRRQKLQDAQRQANQLQNRELRKKRLQKGWQSAKKAINKVNIGRWIDDLERDQELADELELRNAEHREEVERRQIVLQVREACMDAMRMHLVSFLQECPEGSYEEWVAELHPDNISEHDSSVDQRFYGKCVRFAFGCLID